MWGGAQCGGGGVGGCSSVRTAPAKRMRGPAGAVRGGVGQPTHTRAHMPVHLRTRACMHACPPARSCSATATRASSAARRLPPTPRQQPWRPPALSSTSQAAHRPTHGPRPRRCVGIHKDVPVLWTQAGSGCTAGLRSTRLPRLTRRTHLPGLQHPRPPSVCILGCCVLRAQALGVLASSDATGAVCLTAFGLLQLAGVGRAPTVVAEGGVAAQGHQGEQGQGQGGLQVRMGAWQTRKGRRHLPGQCCVCPWSAALRFKSVD